MNYTSKKFLSACKMRDLEYCSVHVQMVWSQRFRKSHFSLDTRDLADCHEATGTCDIFSVSKVTHTYSTRGG